MLKSRSVKNKTKNKSAGQRKSYIFIFILFFILPLMVFFVSRVKHTYENRTNAQVKPPPPFVGCVTPGDWLCMCWNGTEYKYDCSPYDYTEGKNPYLAKCGGDMKKAELQWRWDTGKGLIGDSKCCQGENVCGSFIPERPTYPPSENPNIPPPQLPPPIITAIPTPTFTYRIPTQPVEPTRIYYIPATLPPFIPPTTEIKPTFAPVQLPKPSLNINFDFRGIENFLQSTKSNLLKFFSQVLP